MVLYTTKAMAGTDGVNPTRTKAQMETDIITAYEGANNALKESLGEGAEVTLNVVHIDMVRFFSVSLRGHEADGRGS